MCPDTVFLRKALNFLILVFVAASPVSIALTQSALFLALALWICIMLLERKASVPRTELDFYFLAYVLVGINSMIFSGEKGMLLTFAKRVLLIPIVYLAVGNITNKRFLATLLATLAAVTAALSLVGIQKYLTGLRGLEGRLELFHHYMTSGGILMMLSLMAFSFTLSTVPPKYRILAWASGVLMVFPLVFTFTRSSWLGFLAGLLFVAVEHGRRAILGILIVLAVCWLVAPAPLRDRADSIFQPHHRYNAERLLMWKAGIEILKDYPLGGVGDVDMAKWYARYKPPEAKEQGGHLHNNLVMFGATLGIPGIVFFVVLSLKLFVMEWKILRSIPRGEWLLRGTALGALASYVGFQVNGLFEWNFGDAEIAMLLWLTVGLTLSARDMATRGTRRHAVGFMERHLCRRRP